MHHFDPKTYRVRSCDGCFLTHYETRDAACNAAEAAKAALINGSVSSYSLFDEEYSHKLALMGEKVKKLLETKCTSIQFRSRRRKGFDVIRDLETLRVTASEASEKLALMTVPQKERPVVLQFLEDYKAIEQYYRELNEWSSAYDGWSRYYWGASGGKLHYSSDCKAITRVATPQIASLLSGVPLQKVLTDETLTLCSVCFPDLDKIEDRPRALQVCEGSGRRDYTAISHSMTRTYSAICHDCGETIQVKQDQSLRKHYR